jgi:hypothetical protein
VIHGAIGASAESGSFWGTSAHVERASGFGAAVAGFVCVRLANPGEPTPYRLPQNVDYVGGTFMPIPKRFPIEPPLGRP